MFIDKPDTMTKKWLNIKIQFHILLYDVEHFHQF